jgi:hypothetical protein
MELSGCKQNLVFQSSFCEGSGTAARFHRDEQPVIFGVLHIALYNCTSSVALESLSSIADALN